MSLVVARQAVDRAGRFTRDRPVLAVFFVAIAARAVAATAIFVLSDGTLFLDDSTYADMARQAASGETGRWDHYTTWLFHKTATYTYPLTAVMVVGGGSQLAGQFVTALFGALAAAATTWVAGQALESRWAAVAGMIVALLPSQVLWSSLTLKDAAVWAALALAAACVAAPHRLGSPRALLAFGTATAGVLVLLIHLRAHTAVVTAWSLALAAWFAGSNYRFRRAMVSAAVVLIVPLMFDLGPAGWRVASDAGSLQQRRYLNAQGASTAVVPTEESAAASTDASRTGGSGGVPTVGVSGGDHAWQEGSPAPKNGTPDGLRADMDHLPRGLSVMLLEPYPWQPVENPRLRWAQLEMVLWYPLLLLALFGAVRATPRFPQHLLFPLLVGGGIVLMYALAEGNLGTAYRHRGEFVWCVALFATFGTREITRFWTDSRERSSYSHG